MLLASFHFFGDGFAVLLFAGLPCAVLVPAAAVVGALRAPTVRAGVRAALVGVLAGGLSFLAAGAVAYPLLPRGGTPDVVLWGLAGLIVVAPVGAAGPSSSLVGRRAT